MQVSFPSVHSTDTATECRLEPSSTPGNGYMKVVLVVSGVAYSQDVPLSVFQQSTNMFFNPEPTP